MKLQDAWQYIGISWGNAPSQLWIELGLNPHQIKYKIPLSYHAVGMVNLPFLANYAFNHLPKIYR
ncbi:MAG: hypothetical protein ACK559_00225, partial [bacterium]